jgi:hypothetical protein
MSIVCVVDEKLLIIISAAAAAAAADSDTMEALPFRNRLFLPTIVQVSSLIVVLRMPFYTLSFNATWLVFIYQYLLTVCLLIIHLWFLTCTYINRVGEITIFVSQNRNSVPDQKASLRCIR